MQMIFNFILLLLFGAATSYFANQRGRDPIIWFMIGMGLGILGLILLFILPPLKEQPEPHPVEEDEESLYSQPFPRPAESLTHDYFIKDWFYLDQMHQQFGPVDFEGLRKVWEQGLVNRNSYVWHEGMADWKKVNEMPGLEETLHVHSAL